jgi:hypothetical protein
MLQFIFALLAAVGVFFRSRNDTALEILACGSNSSSQAETATAAVEFVGSPVLDYPALPLVPMGRGPDSGETGDPRRLAPVGFSVLLEVAIAGASVINCWWTHVKLLD